MAARRARDWGNMRGLASILALLLATLVASVRVEATASLPFSAP